MQNPIAVSNVITQPTENTIALFPKDPNQVSDFVRRIIVNFKKNGVDLIKEFPGAFSKGMSPVFAIFITKLFQHEMRLSNLSANNSHAFGYNNYMETILTKQINMESSGNPNAVGGLSGSYYGRSYGLLQVSGVFIPNFKSNGLLPQDFEPNFNSKVPVKTAFYESVQLWLAWMAMNPSVMNELWKGEAYAYGLHYNGGAPYAQELASYFNLAYPTLIV